MGIYRGAFHRKRHHKRLQRNLHRALPGPERVHVSVPDLVAHEVDGLEGSVIAESAGEQICRSFGQVVPTDVQLLQCGVFLERFSDGLHALNADEVKGEVEDRKGGAASQSRGKVLAARRANLVPRER